MKMRWVFLIAAAAVALAGCQGGSGSKSAGGGDAKGSGKAGVFRMPIVTNPTSLDPHIVQDGDTIDLLQQVYEPLVTWNEKNEVVPAVAETWKIDEAGTTYTFTIKSGIKFSSGREVTAEDVKWSIERVTNPALKSATAPTYMNEIVGVPEKLAGTAQEVSGVKVVDERTVSVQIDKPRPYFLSKMTFLCFAVVDKDKVPAAEEIKSAAQMVGTGPYTMENYIPEQVAVLAANPNYHGGAPKLQKIERRVMKDASTRLNAYKNGDIDLVMLERQDIPALQKDAALKDHLQFFDRPAIWYVAMNPLVYKEFADRRVRRAFAMAIDRNFIVEQTLGGVNKVANGIVPPGVFGHQESMQALPFNVAEAKKLLAEAGYPDGKGLPEFTMTFREQRPDIQAVAEAVASQLKENLGVNVKLQTMEWRAYLEKHTAKEQGFFHMRWAADYLDAENFLSTLLATYGPENKVGYSNPAYDALCREADTTLDPNKRLELYAQAEKMVIEDAPFIPIYFQRDAELIHPRVKGMRSSLFGHLPHTTLTVD